MAQTHTVTPDEIGKWPELAVLLEIVTDALFIVDQHGVVVAANSQTDTLLAQLVPEAAEAQLVGMDLKDWSLAMLDADGHSVAPGQSPAMRAAATNEIVACEVIGVRDHAGGLQWFEVDAQPVALNGFTGAAVAVREFRNDRHRDQTLARLTNLQALVAEIASGAIHGKDGPVLAEVPKLAVRHGFVAAAAWHEPFPGSGAEPALRTVVGSRPPSGLAQRLGSGAGMAIETSDGLRWAAFAVGGQHRAVAFARPSDEPLDLGELAFFDLVRDLLTIGSHLSDERRQRTLAFSALDQSHTWYRAILEHSKDAIVVIDEAAAITFASRSAEAITGYRATELVGRNVFDFIAPEYHEPAAEHLLKFLDDDSSKRYHYEIVTRDGSRRWVQVIATNELGNPAVRGMVLNVADVGDLVRYQDELLTSQRQERVARTRLEAQSRLLDAVGEAVVAVDQRGVITYWNAAATSLYGWSEDEAVGVPVRRLLGLADLPDPGWGEPAFMAALSSGVDWSGEVPLRDHDSRRMPVHMTISPVYDSQGWYRGSIAVAFDISELEQAREAAQRTARQQAAVASFGQVALEGMDLDDLMNEGLRLAVQELGIRRAMVTELISDDLVHVTVTHAIGFDPERSPVGKSLPLADTSLVETNAGGGPFVIDLTAPQITQEFGATTSRQFLAGLGVDHVLVAPIATLSEQHGSLVALSTDQTPPRDDDLAFLQGLATVISSAIARNRYEFRLQQLTLSDPLTDLPNLALFMNRVDHAIERAGVASGDLAVAILSLTRLRLVSGTLGLEAADKLLLHVSTELSALVGRGDTLARVGAGEFAVLFERQSHTALQTVETLVSRLAERPLRYGSQEIHPLLSAGVAIGHPECTSERLLQEATAALHKAEGNTGRSTELYTATWHKTVSDRLRIGEALTHAIDRDQFTLQFQPEISLDGDEVWAEALVRWDHPQLGRIGPDLFIPVAEESGFIVTLGRWVLREALETFTGWQRDHPDTAPSSISVNLSAQELTHPDFIATVATTIDEFGIDPAELWFEVTETSLIDSLDAALEVLGQLKALGVGLAIDDFGTGFSSLAYAAAMPADALKIDRRFVAEMETDPRSRSTVEAVIGLAHSLDMLAIAEGVETDEQARQLRELGCDFGQGYLWSWPVAADEIPDWVAAHQSTPR